MQCPFYSRVADEDEKGRFSEIGNFFFWQLGKPKKKPKSERGVATPCSLRTTPSLTDLLVSTSGAESDTFLNQPRPPPTRLTSGGCFFGARLDSPQLRPRALRHGRVSDDPASQDDRLLGREGEHDCSGTETNDWGHHEETSLRTEAVQQGWNGENPYDQIYLTFVQCNHWFMLSTA